jgi:hypothetical protein
LPPIFQTNWTIKRINVGIFMVGSYANPSTRARMITIPLVAANTVIRLFMMSLSFD